MNLECEATTVVDEDLAINTKGVKLTKKRRQVLDVLLASEVPLSAYEIVEAFQVRFNDKIIATSVYRMLDWLAEKGLVHRLNTINKFIACQHNQCAHNKAISVFVICKRCQKTYESHATKQVQTNIVKNFSETSFTELNPQVELEGVCDKCKSHI